MTTLSDYPAGQLVLGGTTYQVVDLPHVCGKRLFHFPVVMRLLMENAIRNMGGSERESAVSALFDWLQTGSSQQEIAFQPGRVLMHDTTSTPALVDIAAMRDTLHEAGFDPTSLNPGIPVDISIDHSLAVEWFAQPNASEQNLRLELQRNAERYTFLRWASKVLDGVRIHPPGTGIMHTINLEQLATVVSLDERPEGPWLVPDMMIGTDSHTPMINGIGVLGWGVGGLEAQSVMFGMPTMLRIPEVIGVRLSGELPAGTLATDLALTVTQRLRAIGVSGEFVEFYGPGVSSLSAGDRAVIANMAPEYGATTGYFPVDQQTLAYLRTTGRDEALIERIEAYTKRMGLWFDPAAEPTYTRTIHIDLGNVGMHIAGPRRPQDLLNYSDAPNVLAALQFQPAHGDSPFPRHPVAIAAITSCTNTSDPRLLVAAGLVARKAREFGLRVPAWVKTSLAPGSPASASYLNRAGLSDDLTAIGFDIVGYGCTTCIGNSGPLPAVIQQAMQDGTIHPVAALSGNRNFPGRIHPDLDLGFLMSPPLVVIFGLAGDAQRDLLNAPVQLTPDGTPVYLQDLWPSNAEIDAALNRGIATQDFQSDFATASQNPLWHSLDAPDTALFPWEPTSTALRRPPFASLTESSFLGHYRAHPLLVLGDDITTDHISPASAIPPDSLVADFLVERGDDRNNLNVFASRRGNWEVMIRGAFHSKTLHNLLAPNAPVAHTLHVPSGDTLPLWEAAQRYRQANLATVLVAGARYGTGSSRDWAAKVQRLLGIRAVLAVSFERIHRSNLIGMGVLPISFPEGITPDSLSLTPGDTIEVIAPLEALSPRASVPVNIHRVDGTIDTFNTTAAVETALEVELLMAGGVIPHILGGVIRKAQEC